MCAISGVLVMSLPIPIIAGNFEKFHKTQHKKNKLLRRRAATVAARIKEEKVKVWNIWIICFEFLFLGENQWYLWDLNRITDSTSQDQVSSCESSDHQDLEFKTKLWSWRSSSVQTQFFKMISRLGVIMTYCVPPISDWYYCICQFIVSAQTIIFEIHTIHLQISH